jgi:neutral ceramidase
MSGSLSVGVASVDVTPPAGLDIAGNHWPTPSLGARDPLLCKALVLDNGTCRAALVAIDILGLERSNVLRARELAAVRAAIPPEQVVITCTHTHQGPGTITMLHGSADIRLSAYMEALPRRIAEAVTLAAASLGSVEWGYTVAVQEQVSHYRRLKLKNGRVRNSWVVMPDDDIVGPAGEIDPELSILAFRTPAALQSLLVNYACHATCYDGTARWSANYPGEFAAAISRSLGLPAEHVLYTAGAEGNINPALRDPATCGQALAAALLPCMDTISWQSTAHLTVVERAITLPPRRPAGFPFDSIVEVYEKAMSPLNFGRIVKAYANAYVKLLERGAVPVETALQVLALDNVAMVAIPGELFVELGREIKQRSPFPQTIVVTLANDYIGYIPHQAAFTEGGYETIFASQSRLAPEAGVLVVEAAVDMLQTISEHQGERM